MLGGRLTSHKNRSGDFSFFFKENNCLGPCQKHELLMHPNLTNFDHKDQHKHNHHVLEYQKDRSTLGGAIDDSGVQFLLGETVKYTPGKLT